MGRSHQTALLNSIIQESQSSSSTWCTTALQAHFLQNIGNRVTNSRSRSQRQINNAKRYAQTTGSLSSHQLTYTGNLESSFLNGFSHLCKVSTLQILQSVLYHTRTANAYANHLFCLANTVESTSHKRIIPRSISKYYQLGTAQSILITSQLCSSLNDFTHLTHAVHVNTSLSRTQINRGANHISSSQSLWNGINQNLIPIGKALLHQCRKTTNKVYANLLGSLVQSLCHWYIGISLAGLSSDSNWRNRNTLVNDGDTVLSLNVLTSFYQKLCRFGNLVIDIATKIFNIRVSTITERNTHSNSTDIQLVLCNHAIGF